MLPKTSSKQCLYPALSFLDIYRVCLKHYSGSLNNQDEADAIISWIFHEKEKIEKLVAVVTPFRKHSENIRIGLEQRGIKDLVVGTVHKLQGAEFPIVIFLPTYTIEYLRSFVETKAQSMFFDIPPSVINVAVSRAKKSFIYIGDPRVLNYGNYNESLPSQILSKHLHKNATKLVSNVKNTSLTKIDSEIKRIFTLESHIRILKQAFYDAQDCVVISSPFIAKSAIIMDDIVTKISHAINGGVRVKIFYDATLNRNRTFDLEKSIKLLTSAGTKVIHKDRLHSKVLYIDNKLIIESSFNWLSAVRDSSSNYKRYESSLVYRGKLAAKMIANVERVF